MPEVSVAVVDVCESVVEVPESLVLVAADPLDVDPLEDESPDPPQPASARRAAVKIGSSRFMPDR